MKMKSELNVGQIKKLWILDLIVQGGSLKAAAARAKISPSAVSQALSALEMNIGKPLILRDRGRVSATETALSILEAVRPAFAVFEKLGTVGSQPVPQMAWLNFGTYESIAVDILPGLIYRLRDKLPHLRLGLQIGRTGQLVKMVRNGDLCSAIVSEVDGLERFYKVPVFEDRLGVYIANRLSRGASASRLIQKYGLGSLAPGSHGLPRYFQRFVKRLGPVKPIILSESFETLRVATASGAITSILPHRVAMRTTDLAEITPRGDTASAGLHKIFVVSRANCDEQETDFLADEVRRLLHSRSLTLSPPGDSGFRAGG